MEVDGAYVGGVVRQENRKADRKDRRLPVNQNGKRQVVVIMRERGGRSLPVVVKSEAHSVPMIVNRVASDAVVYADEAAGWDPLAAWFDTRRINHSVSFAEGEVSTNWAESYFARRRRAEFGIHQHVSGQYLDAYANEIAWREDNRRVANCEQFQTVVKVALAHPVSREWKGYWQRRAA